MCVFSGYTGLMTGRLGYEDNLPSGSRDWNEEFQIVKELPKKTLPERVDRERSHFKVNSDFVWAATRGAQLVVDGCLMPINPGEETKLVVYCQAGAHHVLPIYDSMLYLKQ